MCYLIARVEQFSYFGGRHARAAHRVQPREVLPLPLPANGTELPHAHGMSAMEAAERFAAGHWVYRRPRAPAAAQSWDRCGTDGTLL